MDKNGDYDKWLNQTSDNNDNSLFKSIFNDESDGENGEQSIESE